MFDFSRADPWSSLVAEDEESHWPNSQTSQDVAVHRLLTIILYWKLATAYSLGQCEILSAVLKSSIAKPDIIKIEKAHDMAN